MVLNMELFTNIVLLLLGASVFLTGMKLMSSGLKKLSGKGIKNLLNKTKNNRFLGLGIGAAITSLIQSSDATTVMVIGFITTGVMTVFQGVSIIMGAYIGTTVTGLIVSLSSIKILDYILMLLAFVGTVLMFLKNQTIKNIGEILTGLGLLFFGIFTLKSSLSSSNGDLVTYTVLGELIKDLFNKVNLPILLFLIGILFTMLTQSCSATTGLLIAMVGNNVISISGAIYCAIGATIGAVFPAILTSLSANTNAKRATLVALIIRVLSGVFSLILLWILNSNLNFIEIISSNLKPSFFVAIFMLIYSIITMFILLPFINPLIKLSSYLIKDKESENKKKSIKYIDNHLLNQPSIALMQVKKEILNMYDLSYKNFINGFNSLIKLDFSKKDEIDDLEETIDYINNEITDYLINLSNKVDDKGEREIGSYFHVLNDIERIGDHAYDFFEEATEMFNKDLKFSNEAINELNEAYETIIKMFELSKEIFEKNIFDKLNILHELEELTDDYEIKLNSSHYERLQQNSCNVELSPYYTSLVNALERVADHLTNIGYSIKSPTGDDD